MPGVPRDDPSKRCLAMVRWVAQKWDNCNEVVPAFEASLHAAYLVHCKEQVRAQVRASSDTDNVGTNAFGQLKW